MACFASGFMFSLAEAGSSSVIVYAVAVGVWLPCACQTAADRTEHSPQRWRGGLKVTLYHVVFPTRSRLCTHLCDVIERVVRRDGNVAFFFMIIKTSHPVSVPSLFSALTSAMRKPQTLLLMFFFSIHIQFFQTLEFEVMMLI